MAALSVDWYFDFVSPFSYLALHRLKEFSPNIVYRPVLFAGLLNHFGQKGPAEIPAKRRWTYRWCAWQARELGIPFRFPAAHPFNPLPYLRLSLAAGCSAHAIGAIFQHLWTSGEPAEKGFEELCADLEVAPASLMEVKDTLRKNTEEAAARGVFGVPSFVVDGEVFWGADAIDFLKAFLKDRTVLHNDEMRRVDNLPVAAARKV
jgi:2-hydroxychromene-2-carboxylate isomerase